MTDPHAAHESGMAGEQTVAAGVTQPEDGGDQARAPEAERYVDNGSAADAAAAQRAAPSTGTDSQAVQAHDSEQIAPAGVTEPAGGGDRAHAPEAQRRVDNGLAEDAAAAQRRPALFEADEASGILSRWRAIQAHFVDEPRSAVQDADALVADLMQRLVRMLAGQHSELKSAWASGTDVSTEDLRQGLLRYRSFLKRLLAV